MEATINIKWDDPRELDKMLHNLKMDIARGVKEFESDKIHFRVLDKNELPIFKED